MGAAVEYGKLLMLEKQKLEDTQAEKIAAGVQHLLDENAKLKKDIDEHRRTSYGVRLVDLSEDASDAAEAT